jgi:hypothetical protein
MNRVTGELDDTQEQVGRMMCQLEGKDREMLEC